MNTSNFCTNERMSLWKKQDSFDDPIDFVKEFVAQSVLSLIIEGDGLSQFLFCRLNKPKLHLSGSCPQIVNKLLSIDSFDLATLKGQNTVFRFMEPSRFHIGQINIFRG